LKDVTRYKLIDIQMIGKTISHYKILEQLGQGGMGVIYKAEDTKLKRLVAIKFLPHQIAASAEERERLKIEAQAAAALNHPNIATIYAIEEFPTLIDPVTKESRDEMFIVMEFIDGEELKKKVISDQLSVIRVIDIAAQIAEGLKAAHAKGITHRDIKSSNIMVTESGRVKIMDFGLAKIGGKVQLTKAGTTLGTAAYMSPEQARGEVVDHRTDLFSLGVLLYEMLTGQLPFRGEQETAMLYSILKEAPEPVTNLRPDLPAVLERMVEKALQKDRNARYQRAEELIADMQRMKRELPSTPIPSEQEHEKRKLAAIMFTDMVGYSALTQKNEALALKLLQEQRRLLRAIFPKYAGRRIETVGDAFFVEFASALQAARCAIEIQKNLHERNASASEEKQIKIRIGLHLGDVVHLGKHVHGDGVNIAARIEPLAESGGICISEDVARQIQNKIELPLRKLGKSRLKNIQQAVQIYSIVLPWLKKSDSLAERFYFVLKQRRRFWYRLAAAASVIATLLMAGYFLLRPKTETGAESSLPSMKTVRLTSFQGEEYDPVLSPDGNAIAFSWNGPQRDNFDIYLKLVDAGSR
jgi:serine/threonine protein kinase